MLFFSRGRERGRKKSGFVTGSSRGADFFRTKKKKKEGDLIVRGGDDNL